MRELKIMCVQPIDAYFKWQVHLWLESLKEIGKSDKAVVLVFVPIQREAEVIGWKYLEKLYPEAEFYYYNDEHDINRHIPTYIPILRPYTLWRHFTEYPSLKDKAIFYCDSDIVFTKNFNIDHLLNDDICYVSDTNSYISAAYFDRKKNDVLPDKADVYSQIDILEQATNIVGINRQIAEKNNDHSGGAQYLIKNIDAEFWNKMINDTLRIRVFLQRTNKQYFESENKGFQSWASDMWGLLWNLWYRNQETKVVPEMEFAWSSDPIAKLDKPNIGILHNAGIPGPELAGIPVFFKGKYVSGNSPFKDPDLYKCHLNEKTKTLCNWYYINKLVELKNKYNLD